MLVSLLLDNHINEPFMAPCKLMAGNLSMALKPQVELLSEPDSEDDLASNLTSGDGLLKSEASLVGGKWVDLAGGLSLEMIKDMWLANPDHQLWIEEEKVETKSNGERKVSRRGRWKSQPFASSPTATQWTEVPFDVDLACEFAFFKSNGVLYNYSPLSGSEPGIYVRKKPKRNYSTLNAVALASSRLNYADAASAETACITGADEQAQEELSHKEHHRTYLTGLARERNLGRLGCAIFLEGQDATFACMLRDKGSMPEENMRVPNFGALQRL